MRYRAWWRWGGVLVGLFLAGAAVAESGAGVLRLQAVNDHVYAVVGPLGNRTPENLGNNATFGFVVTDEGVVLIDSGGTYRGAAALHTVIRQVTDQPVKVVINTGGQDHRWLGNGYFRERGARIIASGRAVEDQRARFRDQYHRLGSLVGDQALAGTDAVYADATFGTGTTMSLGGVTFELRHLGPAHTPGDSVVWLPDERVVFAGDTVFVERMLRVAPHSSSRGWIGAFREMAALGPETVVPGHGPVCGLDRARSDTLDYLVFLRGSVGSFMDAGGDITGIGSLDQSRFEYLANYDSLAGRNAQQVYQEMEWE